MGLRTGDLRNLVSHVFEIDSFQSKMGEDSEVVVLSFSVEGKEPAEDLMNFIEKGYEFVLDADVTPGEQADGKYKVFVELERRERTPEQILEIADGVSKLTSNEDLEFRYYKSFKSYNLSLQELQAKVPTDKAGYDSIVNENNLNNFKNFFNRSFLDEVNLNEGTLYICKKYADPLKFEFVDFTNTKDLKTIIAESFDINAYPEIMFLTKYIGDYNISKYGDKLVFENTDKALIVRRK